MTTIRPLSAALLKKAKKEINEKPNQVCSDLEVLKDWLSKQPHLTSVKPTDQWLVAFLRGSKYSLERSKSKLDTYFTLKTLLPEFFSERDPMSSRLQEILKLGVFLPLRKCKDDDSPRICIVRLGVFNPNKFSLTDVIKISFMVTEIMILEDDNFTVAGEEVVVDLDNVGVNILSQWTPALAKKIVSSLEKALPVRVKGNHILNTPIGFEAAYNIFKAFLGEKLRKRFHVHNQKYSGLYKSAPKRVLPSEYGGEDGNIQELIDYWKAKVESFQDYFVSQEHVKSDESQRLECPKTSSIMFGIEGSFRKLEFD